MTINDIKINALMLMFAGYADDLREADVDEMSDPQYTKYTVNMDAPINRALVRIESARVLPLKTITLTAANGTSGALCSRWDLSALASDFSAVSRVIAESDWGYESSVPYEMEGNTIVLPNITKDEEYRVLYHYRPKHIKAAAVSSTVIDVPDYIAELIPYWIKADLYEEDEPSAAVAARNIFEMAITQLQSVDNNGQGCVKDLYGGLL